MISSSKKSRAMIPEKGGKSELLWYIKQSVSYNEWIIAVHKTVCELQYFIYLCFVNSQTYHKKNLIWVWSLARNCPPHMEFERMFGTRLAWSSSFFSKAILSKLLKGQGWLICEDDIIECLASFDPCLGLQDAKFFVCQTNHWV